MAYRIGRNDPEYETAMREAKALFEAAMAKGAAKRGGRPPAAVQVSLAEIDGEEAAVTASQPAAAAEAANGAKAAAKRAANGRATAAAAEPAFRRRPRPTAVEQA